MFIRMTLEDPSIFKRLVIPSPVELPMVRIVTRNSFAEAPRRHFACHAIVHYSVVVGLPLGRTKVALPRSILRARIAFFQREDL